MTAPAISVIVPTKGRPDLLASCLSALGRLREPPGGFEVVVVTDGPDPGSAMAAAAAVGDLTLHVVVGPGDGPASARNTGAAAAAGRLLAFTDDDCEPTPGWLVALNAAAEGSPDAGVGGRTVNGLQTNLFSEASQAITDAFTEWSNGAGGPRFYPSNNLALPAEGFAAIGGFDSRYPVAAGEDRDLCRRWVDSGRGLVDAPTAVVRHMREMDLSGLWRQQRGYGRGARAFISEYPDRPALADSGFVGALHARLANGPDRRRLRLALLVVVAQLATAAGYRAR